MTHLNNIEEKKEMNEWYMFYFMAGAFIGTMATFISLYVNGLIK